MCSRLSWLWHWAHNSRNVSTLCLKTVPTFNLSVTLSNLNRFSKILHCWKAYEICYKPNNFSISPYACCYTIYRLVERFEESQDHNIELLARKYWWTWYRPITQWLTTKVDSEKCTHYTVCILCFSCCSTSQTPVVCLVCGSASPSWPSLSSLSSSSTWSYSPPINCFTVVNLWTRVTTTQPRTWRGFTHRLERSENIARNALWAFCLRFRMYPK